MVFNLGLDGEGVLWECCGLPETGAGGVSIRFGRFSFDAASRELRAGARLVPLSPKAFELLALLVRERPRALSKAELRDRLWPDTFVGETSLPRIVGEVRRALGDSPARGDLVRTVHRFGYAFAGGVDEAPIAAAARSTTGCALLWGDRLIPLAPGENLLGRGPDCALTIPSGLVSRHHARIVVDGEQATLEDLGSKNGTLLSGKAVDGTAPLGDGDELRIGPALLVFCSPGGGSTRSRGSRSSDAPRE
jgi:DNA-binding winged helix-turn-helix (wHTH) protein